MAETSSEGGSLRIGALDGVRGVAVVGVVLFHAFPDLAPGGFFGVESFFVLSGFLLTRVLLTEHHRSGRVDLGAFARRRLRRIVPALWLLLAVLVVVAPIAARADAHRLPGDIASSALGLTNWHLVADQSSYFDQLGRPPLVRHLWSIAVEVQFYLVCPFLVLWAARRRRKVAVAGLLAGIATSAVLMAVLAGGPDPSRSYYGTDTRAGALLSGALLALLLQGLSGAGLERLRRLADPMAALGGVVLVGLCWRGQESMQALYPLGFLAVQAATATAIVGAVAGSASALTLGAVPLRWLGQRSYGIYLWHWPLVALLRPGLDVDWSPATAGLAGIAFALVLGHASYTLVERPLLGPSPRRVRLPPSARPLAVACSALLVAGVAGVVVNLPSADPIAETLRAGEQILTSQALSPPVPAVPVVAPTLPVAPTTTKARTTPTTRRVTTVAAAVRPKPMAPAPSARPAALDPGPAPGTVSVTAIGDSVMLSAAGPLTARLGPTGSVDAKVARQFRDGVGIVSTLRQQGRLAPVVVVHLGTNGPPKPADVDALISATGGTSRVLFLTVRVSRSWTAETNAVLVAAPARHHTAAIVDWYGYSEGHGDWFHSDGTHLTTSGAQAYAALIGSALPAATPPPTTPPVVPPALGTTTTIRP